MSRSRVLGAFALSALPLCLACHDSTLSPKAPLARVVGTRAMLGLKKGQCLLTQGLLGTHVEVQDNAIVLTAQNGSVVTRVAIKAGTDCYFTVENVTGMVVIDVGGLPCYRVVGLGTATVTVTRIGEGPSCKDISNVEYLTGPAPGQLRICKIAGPGIAAGTNFSFTVGAATVTVPASPAPGSCVMIGPVPAGTATIQESPQVGTVVSSVSTAPADALVSFDLAARTAQATITSNALTEITFTNVGTTGFLEICKASGSPAVSGTFSFVVAGQTYGIPVGACSPPIQVPAGSATVTELAHSGAELSGVSALPPDRLISFNLAARTAVVTIVPGDISTMTILTFTNRAVPMGFLETCKASGTPAVTGSFSFVVAGQTYTIPVGACSPPIQLPAGSATVTELARAGAMLTGVQALPVDRLLSFDLAARTATVAIVAGDISTQTIVSFTNRATSP